MVKCNELSREADVLEKKVNFLRYQAKERFKHSLVVINGCVVRATDAYKST